jgi:hypothetical protein
MILVCSSRPISSLLPLVVNPATAIRARMPALKVGRRIAKAYKEAIIIKEALQPRQNSIRRQITVLGGMR